MSGRAWRHILLTVLAASALLSACTTGPSGDRGALSDDGGPAGKTTTEASVGPRVVSREIPSDESSAGVVIDDVRATNEMTFVFVGRTTDSGDGTDRQRVGGIAYTSDASVGPADTWVQADDSGAFLLQLEFPLEHRGDAWPYNIAMVGGRRVYLDLDEGLWAVGEDDAFRPIEGWRW
ncbi:MAG: hypothetical protein ABFC80_06245 [Coriobacteriales bacterium]|nr:hypothetical protein [Actinomycetes bacterium]